VAAVQHQHSLARQQALQLLYQYEVTGSALDRLATTECLMVEVGMPSSFTWRLLKGACAHLDEVDALIGQAAKNWSLQRLPLVDLCVLRLAVYEMKYVREVPISVTINEAVELARVFGGDDDSPRFINGVLGNIDKTLRGKKPQPGEALQPGEEH
jgi:N utilization substance protein B